MDTQELLYEDSMLVKQLLQKRIYGEFDCAIALYKNNETRYQIMTDTDLDFFDWYCSKFPNDQFYRTPLLAMTAYIKHRDEWLELGMPDWRKQ